MLRYLGYAAEKRRLRDPKWKWDSDSVWTELMCTFIWKFRQINHYFLAEEVADFCASSVKDLTQDYLKALPSCSLLKPPPNDKAYNFGTMLHEVNGEAFMDGAFAIHFPLCEKRHSVIVIPEASTPAFENPTHYYKYAFAACANDDIMMVNPNIKPDSFGSDSCADWYAKLIFGFSLYIDAFPDTVAPSQPGTITNEHHYGKTRIRVELNDIAKSEARSAMSPHFRRGHFRLLSSDKFVKKRGQTIFIKGVFVKGKAFDVLTTEPSKENAA